MRDLSCLTDTEKEDVKDWLNDGGIGCWISDSTINSDESLISICARTCGKVFPECVGKTSFGVDYISCPCNKLTRDYVISELGGLPHE